MNLLFGIIGFIIGTAIMWFSYDLHIRNEIRRGTLKRGKREWWLEPKDTHGAIWESGGLDVEQPKHLQTTFQGVCIGNPKILEEWVFQDKEINKKAEEHTDGKAQ